MHSQHLTLCNLMCMVFDGVVWAGLAMIWVWQVGVANVLELVFKKLGPMPTQSHIGLGRIGG